MQTSLKAMWNRRRTGGRRDQERTEEDVEACPFEDVMDIYDHDIDKIIEALNNPNNVAKPAASSNFQDNRLTEGDFYAPGPDKSVRNNAEVVEPIPQQNNSVRQKSSRHGETPIARVRSLDDQKEIGDANIVQRPTSDRTRVMGASCDVEREPIEIEVNDPLLGDDNARGGYIEYPMRNVPKDGFVSSVISVPGGAKQIIPEPQVLFSEYKKSTPSSESVKSISRTEGNGVANLNMMTAPGSFEYYKAEQKTALAHKMSGFLKEGKYSLFVRALFRSIKNRSEKAVETIVETLKLEPLRYNLGDRPFRERDYTASALHVALLFERYGICRRLITEFPDLVSVKYESNKFKNQTAFHIAASSGQLKILKLMLKVVSDQKGDDEGIRLLNTKADGTYFRRNNPEGTLALTAAAWSGHVRMVGELIKSGADLEACDHRGNTLLHYIITLSAMHPKSNIPRRLFDEVWDKCAIWRLGTRAPKTPFDPTSSTNDDHGIESENQLKMAQVEAFKHLLSIRNKANQNILSLSVNLHSNLTKHILNQEHIFKRKQAKFGTTLWSTYDVTEVTSFGPAYGAICRYNPCSVLHILAHRTKVVTRGEDETYNDLIQEEPILTLVKMKWRTYRVVYILWGVAHLTMMLGLTTVSLQLNTALNEANKSTLEAEPTYNTTNATFHMPGETVEIIGRKIFPGYLMFGILPLIYLVLEGIDICSTGYSSFKSLDTGVSWQARDSASKSLDTARSVSAGNGSSKSSTTGFRRLARVARHLMTQWTVTGNEPYRLCSSFFSVFVLSWLFCHLNGTEDQDVPLALAMVFGWLFMLFFMRACRYVCSFSVMMQKMFFEDCLYFIAIYIFFWLAFSTALHVLLLDRDTPGLHVWNTLYGMLNVVTDAGEKASGEVARIPGIAVFLQSIYAVVSVILLLNLLIAMMNTSYEAVKNSKTNIWRNQQLSIILLLERRLWWWVWLCENSQKDIWLHESRRRKHPMKRLFVEVTGKSCFESDDTMV